MHHRHRLLAALVALVALAAPASAASHAGDAKFDGVLLQRAHSPHGWSRVIVRTRGDANADKLIRVLHGTAGRYLPSVRAYVALVPDASLDALAASDHVVGVSLD